ncbi:MAG: TonB-dependent receptor [Pseudomonadota bacterium]
MKKLTRTRGPRFAPAKLSSALLLSAAVLPFANVAIAQEDAVETTEVEATETEEDARELDVITITGTRQVIQDSIALKRSSTQIVDGLSADEIGDIPALSIGEALENVTGVASHRENGGATEVSIRGLGPYLSSTVVNGRAATNGSGDRSVNFSQFPSELINKLAVFKTQDASQIEGGVAGQIQLETLRPLDFGKRRFQGELKGNYNPDQQNIEDSLAGDLGYRGTLSYVDQFELEELGDFGISIGLQRSDISQPEAESRQTGPTSNSRPACLITDGLAQYTDQTFGGTFTGFSNNPETEDRGDDDCDDFNDRRNADNLTTRGSDTEGVDTTIDPATGLAIDAGTPFVFAPSQRHYRQNDTRDQRDAFFGQLQWQPNNRWDINLDMQWSERSQEELRSDLTFNGGRRNDTSLNVAGTDTTSLDSLVTNGNGGILRAITDNTIEVQGGDWQRVETYLGGGLSIEHEVTDRLTLGLDLSHSNTERTERAWEFRIQSDISPVIEYDLRSSDVPVYRLYDEEFDVNDPANYVDRLRVRIDNDVFRDNTINALRFDADYEMDGFFTNIEAGFRVAEQDYLELPGGADSGDPLGITSGRFSFEIENDGELTVNNREVIDDSDDDLYDTDPRFLTFQDDLVSIIADTNAACYQPFREGNSFLESQRSGNLVTNIDDDGNVLSSTNSWATFDARCVAETSAASLNNLLNTINAFLTDPNADENSFAFALNAFNSGIPGLIEENTRTIDVNETTNAFYVMANYETTIGNFPVSGNIGARIVQTEVEATGYRPEIIITDTDGELSASFGDLVPVTASHDYTEFLPSAIAIVEVAPDKLVRLGVFRAMSRPDPADMGFGRTFNFATADDDADPITSLSELITNVSGDGNPGFDPLMSWNFDAGFEWYPNDDTILAFSGYYKSFQGGFANTIQEETYSFNGENLTLPIALPQTSDDTSELYGLEITAAHTMSYLPGLWSGLGGKLSYNYVDSDFEFEDSRYGDQFVVQLDGSIDQIADGILDPGGLPGLSENTLSAQAFWGYNDFDVSVTYKYRDEYFQPFVSDGTRLRFVGDVGVWEARASYNVNDNIRLSVEAINLGSAPKEQYAFTNDDLYEVNDYGPRIFFGVRGRF